VVSVFLVNFISLTQGWPVSEQYASLATLYYIDSVVFIISVTSYETQGTCPPRLPTVYFLVTSEPHKL